MIRSALQWLREKASEVHHVLRTPKWAEPHKPCGCPASRGYMSDLHPPDATKVERKTRREREEHEASTVIRQYAVVVFRCHECGDKFEVDTNLKVQEDVVWEDGEHAESEVGVDA